MLKGASGRDVVNALKEKTPRHPKKRCAGRRAWCRLTHGSGEEGDPHRHEGAAGRRCFVLILLIVLLADIRSALIVTLVLCRLAARSLPSL